MSDEPTDRRSFFRRASREITARTVEELDARARKNAARWVRPPFALEELDFLLACTRCNACLEACPTGVIFPLATRLGATVAGSPALDLLNRSCRLCPDWPCVAACAPGALKRTDPPETESPRLPRLAVVRIDPSVCLPYLGPECGACRDSCPVDGALLWDGERPKIDPEQCAGCARCREACVVEPKAVMVTSIHDDRPGSTVGTG